MTGQEIAWRNTPSAAELRKLFVLLIAGTLVVGSLGREPPSAPTQEASAPICAWDSAANSSCSLSSAAIDSVQPFRERETYESAFYSCFDRDDPMTPCTADAVAGAPPPAPRSGAEVAAASPADVELGALVRPLGMGVTPETDYMLRGPCPYDGFTNPITSGDLPDDFQLPSNPDYVPFKPRAAFFDNDTTCDPATDPALLAAAGQVLVKHEDGTCSACPEAVCTLWQPNGQGFYVEPCTGRLQIAAGW